MAAILKVGKEELVSKKGTIIPHALRFENDTILVTYHTGNDTLFTSYGASISYDNGVTWDEIPEINRASAMGISGSGRALLLDQALWRTGKGEYCVLTKETNNSAKSFISRTAKFYLDDAVDKEYVPRSENDPDYSCEPAIPEQYRSITDKHGAFIGGHLFGHIIRLADGALGVSAYCLVKGNMTRPMAEKNHVGKPADQANAPEATDKTLFSSIFFRSNDEGNTWHRAGTIGKVLPGKPFDAGILHSEGFTETDVVQTSDNRIYAMMRHGSYMLLWWTFSNDGGYTWTEPICHTCCGVAPNLVKMPNSMVAGTWGRPGLTVGLNLDGTAQNWDIMTTIFDDRVQSQKYPWLVPVAQNKLLLFYDRRKWDSANKKIYDHGIFCRMIEISQN